MKCDNTLCLRKENFCIGLTKTTQWSVVTKQIFLALLKCIRKDTENQM